MTIIFEYLNKAFFFRILAKKCTKLNGEIPLKNKEGGEQIKKDAKEFRKLAPPKGSAANLLVLISDSVKKVRLAALHKTQSRR